VYEWEPERLHNRELDAESQWIICECEQHQLAIGAIYFAVDTKQNSKWNDHLETRISWDLLDLQQQGKQVILFGDFKGHIHTREGTNQSCKPTDRNDIRVMNISSMADLTIANFQQTCSGKWTWMKKDHSGLFINSQRDPTHFKLPYYTCS
jgi:hypothetical protein